MFKKSILILFIAFCIHRGFSQTSYENPKNGLYPTISYLNIHLDSQRRLPTNPYILEFKKGKKQIIFCGVNHLTDNSDTLNPLFTGIENKFFAIRPQVAVNEGGDVSKRQYKSKYDALLRGGEIGLLKVLSDSLRIPIVNGDADTPYEFNELLKRYSKGEFLAYIGTERCMWELKGDNVTDLKIIEKRYNRFIENYIIKRGNVPLTDTEKSFQFFKNNYQTLLNRPFDIEELEPTDPFDPEGKFQEIGRTSKEIRDQFLLKTIDNLLDTYDSVFIVFGGWHLLTCEPALRQIIDKK